MSIYNKHVFYKIAVIHNYYPAIVYNIYDAQKKREIIITCQHCFSRWIGQIQSCPVVCVTNSLICSMLKQYFKDRRELYWKRIIQNRITPRFPITKQTKIILKPLLPEPVQQKLATDGLLTIRTQLLVLSCNRTAAINSKVQVAEVHFIIYTRMLVEHLNIFNNPIGD